MPDPRPLPTLRVRALCDLADRVVMLTRIHCSLAPMMILQRPPKPPPRRRDDNGYEGRSWGRMSWHRKSSTWRTARGRGDGVQWVDCGGDGSGRAVSRMSFPPARLGTRAGGFGGPTSGDG